MCIILSTSAFVGFIRGILLTPGDFTHLFSSLHRLTQKKKAEG